MKNKKQINKESFDGMFLTPEEPTGNLMDDIIKILKWIYIIFMNNYLHNRPNFKNEIVIDPERNIALNARTLNAE